MRIALISPYSAGPLRGNIITVDRISRFLRKAGMETLILPADTLSIEEMERLLVTFAPHIIHGFHARYCGNLARHLASQLDVPFAITITGSDLHDPLLRNHPDTGTAIDAAQGIVCFNDSEASELAGCFPSAAQRITVISQGVEQLAVIHPDDFGLSADDFMLLLPAAIRPVKQLEFPLQALAGHPVPAIRLIFAGGIIDKDYAANIISMIDEHPYATWLGEVPREKMGNLYARADVVLNCSRFESMPNTVLEAMALERPVLAADIPGNRALVSHNDTGLLYRDAASFSDSITRLAGDSTLRTSLGRHAGEFIRNSFSPKIESEKHICLYQRLINQQH